MSQNNLSFNPDQIYYEDEDKVVIYKKTREVADNGVHIHFNLWRLAAVICIIITVISNRNLLLEIVDEKTRENPGSGISTPDSSNSMIFSETATRCLTEQEIDEKIAGKSPAEAEGIIQTAINDIYAAHGKHFYNESYRKYYSQFSWYEDRGLTDDEVKSDFTDFERENVDLLAEKRDQLKPQ